MISCGNIAYVFLFMLSQKVSHIKPLETTVAVLAILAKSWTTQAVVGCESKRITASMTLSKANTNRTPPNLPVKANPSRTPPYLPVLAYVPHLCCGRKDLLDWCNTVMLGSYCEEYYILLVFSACVDVESKAKKSHLLLNEAFGSKF